jgi:hypothetical protein
MNGKKDVLKFQVQISAMPYLLILLQVARHARDVKRKNSSLLHLKR